MGGRGGCTQTDTRHYKGWPWTPRQESPLPQGNHHSARAGIYLCRQPALCPRCTRASKRLLTENNSLTLKKSECLRGSLRIDLVNAFSPKSQFHVCGLLSLAFEFSIYYSVHLRCLSLFLFPVSSLSTLWPLSFHGFSSCLVSRRPHHAPLLKRLHSSRSPE